MLRQLIDKIKPMFEKGQPLHPLHSTFDAFETLLFVPNTVTKIGSHIRDSMDMKRTMVFVILSLMPCFLFGTYNIGAVHFGITGQEADFWQTLWFGATKMLPMLIISYGVGLSIEFIFAQVRGHEVQEGFLVSGILIPLICPPDIPLWMLAIAVAFAVIIGKEVFGGTGMNIWNPALLARAFLFFAYPAKMSGDAVWAVDASSGPTALASVQQGLTESIPTISELFWGFIPGSVGETSKFCILLGALFLLITGIASFRIMLSVILGGGLMAFLLNALGVSDITAIQHLLMGGFLFGAVFMATDPVTASQTNIGKLIYGFLIGILAVLIRVFNPAYPEGMMLAILFMNTFAPLIDHIIVNRNMSKRKKRLQLVEKEALQTN